MAAARRRRCSALIALGLVALWLFQSIYTVQPDELARRTALRQAEGRTVAARPAFPLVADRDGRDSPTPPKSSSTSAKCAAAPSSGLMLSGDQNIVDVKFSVAYQVSNPEAYLFNVADPDDMVRQVGESAMREVVGRRPAQDIFRDDRQGIADDGARDHPDDARRVRRRPRRSTRSRSRTRRRRAKWPTRSTRCSAPSRTKTASSRSRTSIPTRSSARRAVRPRRSAKKRPPTRTGSCRKRRVRRSASSRSMTNMPRRRT